MPDNVQLQGIEFQIVAGDSTSAVSGITKLTSSLKKLQTVTANGIGLKAVIAEIKSFNDSISTTDTEKIVESAKSVNRLAKAIERLASAGAQLGAVRESLQGIAGIDFSSFNTAAENMKAVKGFKMPKDAEPLRQIAEEKQSAVETVDGGIAESTGGFAKATQMAIAFHTAISKVTAKLASLAVAAVKTGASLAYKFGKAVVGTTLINPLKKFGNTIKDVVGSFRQFMSSIGRIAMYRAIRGLISSITRGFKEGVGYLNVYSKLMSTAFHQSLSLLATDALYLKNSLATVAAPIIDTLAPAIDYLTDKLAEAFNMAAQLFAKLSGKSEYTKAIKYATEYTDSISQAADKVKDFTAGFDELNVFNASTGSGSNLAQNASRMFEEATVDSDIGDFAARIRKSINAGDWRALGTLLGEKVNSVFAGVNWETLGQSVGSKIGAVISTAYHALRTIDFRQIGSDLASAVNGIIGQIDFYDAGRLLAIKLTSIIDFLIGALGMLDWKRVGAAIGDFIRGVFDQTSEWLESVDWGSVGSQIYYALYDLIVGLDFNSLSQVFWELLGAAIAANVKSFFGFLTSPFEQIRKNQYTEGERTAGEIVKGFWKGIKDANMNIVLWIKQYMFDPFIQGFKSIFGIASPSTVMAEQGQYIVEGLLKGISDTWHIITEYFDDKVSGLKRGWADNWESMRRTANEKWTVIGSNLGQKWSEIQRSATDKFAGVHDRIVDAWTSVENSTNSRWTRIASVLSSAWRNISDAADDALATLSQSFDNFYGYIRNIANAIIRVFNRVIDGFNDLMYFDFDGLEIMGAEIIPAFSFQLAELPRIPYLAEGGVVDSGQLFVARERGPELVGQIGASTVVANNEQIEAGIASGVRIANADVVAAIYDLLGVVENKDLAVTIGDGDIGRSYDRYNQQRGVRVNSGAFANAY